MTNANIGPSRDQPGPRLELPGQASLLDPSVILVRLECLVDGAAGQCRMTVDVLDGEPGELVRSTFGWRDLDESLMEWFSLYAEELRDARRRVSPF